MDIVTKARRSAMMAGVRGKDTQPELRVRQIAHSLGFRYRWHRHDLPGSPDLVFPRLKKVIFVHGCYWRRAIGRKHGRDYRDLRPDRTGENGGRQHKRTPTLEVAYQGVTFLRLARLSRMQVAQSGPRTVHFQTSTSTDLISLLAGRSLGERTPASSFDRGGHRLMKKRIGRCGIGVGSQLARSCTIRPSTNHLSEFDVQAIEYR